MKRSKHILAAAVMAAVLVPVYNGGGIASAADLPASGDTSITSDQDYTVPSLINKNLSVTGTGEESVSLKDGDSIAKDKGVLLAQSSAKVGFNNLKSLTITDSGNNKDLDGLSAWGGASITLNGIGTVNIGSAEDRFNSGGCALHGASGHITLSDVGDVNIYTDGTGIMAQNNNSANDADPSVSIKATGNVTIDANTVGVQASSLNKNKGIAKAEIISDKEVNIISRNSVAVYSADRSIPYDGAGSTEIVIKGKDGVNISGGNAIQMSRWNEAAKSGYSSFDIESENGDVNLISTSNAIYINTDKTGTANSTATINGTIKGNNVNISNSVNGALIGLDKGSDLNIAVNKDNGIINLDSVTGTAANLANGAQLTLGDGNAKTTIQTNGLFAVGKDSSVTVAGNTTTIVDAAALKNQPLVITADGGRFNAENGAKLKISGAYTGDHMYSGNNVTFWSNENTSFDNAFQYLDDNGVVQAGITEANKASIAGFIAPSVAIAATAANDSKINPIITAGADSYNAAVGIGQAGGVQHSTYEVAGLFADALTDHEDTPEKDVWAKAFHSKKDVDKLGFDGGALNLDTQYNGAVAGVDLYQDENTAAGVAIAYADGNISGTNGAVYTKNDAQYVGVSLYGRKDLGSYRLAGDLSYLHGSHDITQYNGGSVITADPDTNAWSLGVKALKDYDLGSGTLTPYIGARYLRLSTDGYTSSLGISYGSEDQDLFLFPVGVDYSLDVQHGSWNIKPYAGLGYIWTTGDRNADQSVSFGTGADTFAYDVTDAGSFLAKAGISAENDRYSFGLGYAYQNGSSVDSDTWSIQAAYKF